MASKEAMLTSTLMYCSSCLSVVPLATGKRELPKIPPVAPTMMVLPGVSAWNSTMSSSRRLKDLNSARLM